MLYDEKQNKYVRQGVGRLEYKNKDYYEGGFIDDLFEGKGVLKKHGKKGIYEGFFRAGLKEGTGVLKDANGNIFEGQFFKGQKSFGIEKFKTGEIYEGEYVNGKKEGVGVLRYAPGSDIDFYQGEFKDDKVPQQQESERVGEGALSQCRAP